MAGAELTTQIERCGNPECDEPKAEGRHVCEEHAAEYSRIKEELENDPLLLYHQRSDSQHRKVSETKKKRPPRAPTCCAPGCFEPRMPPSPYCDAHEGFAGGD